MGAHLHAVYASDDRFAEILGVSLTSLYDSNRAMEEITVYVLDSGISDENKREIELVSKNYGRDVHWIKAKDISNELGIGVSADRGSLSQYARLFVSSALPEGVSRVLYLDCDTLILQPLGELWNLDMEGMTLAGVRDAVSGLYRRNIGLAPDDVMINSGVMLIDIDRWKERSAEGRLLDFIKSRNGNILQGDQGAINAVLSRETYCLDPKFNAVTLFYDFSYDEIMAYRKPRNFYSRGEVDAAAEHPAIVHFTTSFMSRRPWYEGCRHPFAGEWLRYKKTSPWKDIPLWKYEKPRGMRGVYSTLASRLPRRLVIFVSGLLHAYAWPLLDRVKGCFSR